MYFNDLNLNFKGHGVTLLITLLPTIQRIILKTSKTQDIVFLCVTLYQVQNPYYSWERTNKYANIMLTLYHIDQYKSVVLFPVIRASIQSMFPGHYFSLILIDSILTMDVAFPIAISAG